MDFMHIWPGVERGLNLGCGGQGQILIMFTLKFI